MKIRLNKREIETINIMLEMEKDKKYPSTMKLKDVRKTMPNLVKYFICYDMLKFCGVLMLSNSGRKRYKDSKNNLRK